MRKLLAGLLALFMVFVAACSSSGGTGQGSGGGSQGGGSAPAEEPAEKILTYAYNFQPGTLDTSRVTDNMGGDILYHLSEGLMRFYGGEVVPGIAERWEVSEDGTTYTFYLREATWEDGVPVTADDFVYSVRRLLSPDTGSPMADQAYDILNAAAYHNGELTDPEQVGVRALDDRTLEIRLERPVPYFLLALATSSSFYPLRQDFVEQAGSSYGTSAEHFLSNGPFRLAEWQHEASIRMVKNERYWNADAVKLDGITFLVVPDSNTILNMYDNGEVDLVLSLPAGHEANYPDHEVRWFGTIAFLEFNTAGSNPEAGKLMGNLNFRKALSYAIDRVAFNRTAVSALAEPTSRFAHPTWPGLSGAYADEFPVENTVPLEGDPELANQFLEAALAELGLSRDQLPTLTYVVFEQLPRRMIAEALVDQWRQVLGLNNIEMQVLPIPQAIQAGFAGQFDIYYQTMSAGVDPYLFLVNWTSGHGLNWTRWSDPTYDALVVEANALLDPAERLAALRDAEQRLIDVAPLAATAYERSAHVVREGVTGVEISFPGAGLKAIYADVQR